MFVCVARVVLNIPAAQSLAARRQAVRRVIDRVQTRFNVSLCEAANDTQWNRADVGLSVVGNTAEFAREQVEKIIRFIDEMYVAPVAERELNTVAFSDLNGFEDRAPEAGALLIPRRERTLAEAEGLSGPGSGVFASLPGGQAARPSRPGGFRAKPTAPNLQDAKTRARTLRNPREWEDK